MRVRSRLLWAACVLACVLGSSRAETPARAPTHDPEADHAPVDGAPRATSVPTDGPEQGPERPSTPATPAEILSVSVIMPTNSRPEFVENALRMIRAQDYPAELIREVIVVDDSPPELRVPGLVEGSQQWDGLALKYILPAQLLSIGAKRNLAVEAATGEVIVHSDDDDCYGASPSPSPSPSPPPSHSPPPPGHRALGR